ncbi:hypothetical protein [Nocardia fluminea]|uniref:hypothetical protein n=1 Tax=Nocardia fluminea TaxID=134984 RepID=UPI003D10F9FD
MQVNVLRLVPTIGGEAENSRSRSAGFGYSEHLSTERLVAATIALGHAAWQHLRGGRLNAVSAATQFRSAVLRMYSAG